MNLLKTSILALGLGLMVAACGGETAPKEAAPKAEPEAEKPEMKMEAEPEADAPWSMTKDGITITEKTSAPEYPGAGLTLDAPAAGEAVAGANNFKFTVTPGENDYQLGNQTEGANANGCANSAKGQHIHFIVNNAPYKAFYTPEFESELGEGSNVVLAFISRSYHESIKAAGAFVVTEFNTSGGDPADLSGKHLFYSRPKGTYKGEFAKKVLLDFYVVNTELAEDGDQVKVTVNGTEFMLPMWVPYTIEGMPMGENTIMIELVDAEGNMIEGPFNNSGERVITLTEEEPAN